MIQIIDNTKTIIKASKKNQIQSFIFLKIINSIIKYLFLEDIKIKILNREC